MLDGHVEAHIRINSGESIRIVYGSSTRASDISALRTLLATAI